MANKIQVKRGLQANLPALDVGEVGFTTDQKRTYIGSSTGNVELAKASELAEKTTKGEIVSGDLKVSSDADRLKLVNMSDEVLQAMAGTTSINATPAPFSTTKEKIAPKAVTADKTDFLKIGKNLLNPALALENQLLVSDGTTTAFSNYKTSDFIEVEPGVNYALSFFRSYNQYDANKQNITGSHNNTGNNNSILTITPLTNARYIRVSYSTPNEGKLQVERGSAATAYEPYTPYVDFERLKLTQGQVEQVIENIVFPGEEDMPIKVTKTGETFVLQSDFDDVNKIEIETSRNGSYNGSFNFIQTKVGTTVIHGNGDDITPIRTFATVGANHGYTTIVVIGMSGHGKTTSDLGSQWTDGVTTYTLLSISGNNLTFACPYTVTNGITSSTKITPVADLTHVSGATNTGNVSITTIASSSQLYPSINNISVKYILDGKEITKDGTHNGEVLEIQEQYSVMDYKAIIDFAQANIGVSYANDSVEGVVQLTNTFVFRKGLKCTTSHGLKALKKVSLGTCGFLQSVALLATGHTRKRFMPGVLPKGGFDFEAGVDLDAYATSLLFEPADNKIAGVAPSHYTDWLYQSGVRKFGFTMGYIVDKTNTKHADRIALGGTMWDMRSTKKSYPVALKGTLQAGDYRSFMGFRNYLSPQDVGAATTLNIVEDAKDTYLYAHLNTPITNLSKRVGGRIGDNITAIQNDGITLKNDVVDASGVVVSATGAVSNAIIRLT